MKIYYKKIAFLIAAFVSIFSVSMLSAENIDEIKKYFELRDTMNLVNLEMKRALSSDSRSPLIKNPDAEKNLTRLLLFLENRIQQFAVSKTPLKYHYIRRLKAQFEESRQLYSNVIVRIRSGAFAQVPTKPLLESLPVNKPNLGERSVASTKPPMEQKIQDRPYFHPIDVRTLLSPALLNSPPFNGNPYHDGLAAKGTDPRSLNIGSKTQAVAGKDSNVAKTNKVITEAKPEEVINKAADKNETIRPNIESTESIESEPATQIIGGVTIIPPPPAPPEKAEEKVPTKALEEKPVKPTEITANLGTASVAKPPSRGPIPLVSKLGQGEARIIKGKAMRPLAVMIENHRKARPQTGLIDAEVVYEMPVEGGITRFMALFFHVPGKLGPVRSCREYFVDRALEVDALYVHCGGSPKGYAYLSKSKINSIDEIKHGKPFYRFSKRKAPHNLYTTGKRLKEYMDKKIAMELPQKKLPLVYGSVESIGAKPGERLKIKYHGNYSVSYKYDKVTDSYLRFMNGAIHKDLDTSKPISPHSVVIQEASMKTVDKAGRQDVDFIGSGKAYYLQSGRLINGKWTKKSANDFTEFLDDSGNPVVFKKGKKVWIQVVAPRNKVLFNPILNSNPGAAKNKAKGTKAKKNWRNKSKKFA